MFTGFVGELLLTLTNVFCRCSHNKEEEVKEILQGATKSNSADIKLSNGADNITMDDPSKSTKTSESQTAAGIKCCSLNKEEELKELEGATISNYADIKPSKGADTNSMDDPSTNTKTLESQTAAGILCCSLNKDEERKELEGATNSNSADIKPRKGADNITMDDPSTSTKTLKSQTAADIKCCYLNKEEERKELEEAAISNSADIKPSKVADNITMDDPSTSNKTLESQTAAGIKCCSLNKEEELKELEGATISNYADIKPSKGAETNTMDDPSTSTKTLEPQTAAGIQCCSLNKDEERKQLEGATKSNSADIKPRKGADNITMDDPSRSTKTLLNRRLLLVSNVAVLIKTRNGRSWKELQYPTLLTSTQAR